jgi:glycosyltransferase involved in cell wall biosynthesis
VTSTATGGDWFHDQVVGLTRRGHVVQVVLPAAGPLAQRLASVGVPVHIVPFSGWRPHQLPRVAKAQHRLMRLIRQFKPEVVHSHLLKATVACRVSRMAGDGAVHINQIAGTVHLRSPVLRRIDSATLRGADVVIGSCSAFARRYEELGARRVAVSHYGCDVRRLDPSTPGHDFRREFGLAANVPLVGMIAHMYRSRIRAFGRIGFKGHEVFIESVPPLLRRVPEAHAFVVGDEFHGDGLYRRALERLADEQGVSDRIHFTGHRSDTQSVLAGLDVLVCPSLEESASYAAIEGLLMRKGVVASNVGGLPDTVQHDETGLLVPAADPVALAEAVASLLTDVDRRRRLGTLGRERCLQRFDIQRTVADVEAIYFSAISTRERIRG